jgi:protoporphyrinogen oxidase
MSKIDKSVIIIGAGIAGLTAAKFLKQFGFSIKIFEASDGVGGRVRTFKKDGFLLDKGFQVLLGAYPVAKEILDFKALKLKPFLSGAKVLHHNGISNVVDPLRQPSGLFETIFSPIGNLKDKLLMLKLKLVLYTKNVEQIFEEEEQSTKAFLMQYGFSEKMITNFFVPFLGGIFLEKELTTSSRMFNFVFKMFGEGEALLPEEGIQAIPNQLAEGLQADELFLNTRVAHINKNEITLDNGSLYEADYILIATNELNLPTFKVKEPGNFRKVLNLYFKTKTKPFTDALIGLVAKPNCLVNNIAVLDNVSPSYNTGDQFLISLSIIDNIFNVSLEEIINKSKDELSFWFDVSDWEYVDKFEINYALPNQDSIIYKPKPESLVIDTNIYICGDYLTNGSLNAAMLNGKTTADLIYRKSLIK